MGGMTSHCIPLPIPLYPTAMPPAWVPAPGIGAVPSLVQTPKPRVRHPSCPPIAQHRCPPLVPPHRGPTGNLLPAQGPSVPQASGECQGSATPVRGHEWVPTPPARGQPATPEQHRWGLGAAGKGPLLPTPSNGRAGVPRRRVMGWPSCACPSPLLPARGCRKRGVGAGIRSSTLPPRHLAPSISHPGRQPDIRLARPGGEVARAWHCARAQRAPHGGPAGVAGPARGAAAIG